MDRSVAALVAVLLSSIAQAQGTTHSHHPSPAKPESSPITPARSSDRADGYRSVFSDYQPFSQELAPKEWRRANDEVREAGGTPAS